MTKHVVGENIIYHGHNIDVLKTLPDNSIDSIVTDPPYELGFMGKTWDNSGIAYNVELWQECLRVLKPGGHLLSFGGTRTFHRVAVAIEEAGFEIRDSIAWLYGSGFPKSLDVAKAINKSAGVEYEAKPASGVGFMNAGDDGYNTTLNQLTQVGESTDEAKQWQGWGTALKPAHEPIIVARKPLIGTVAENVLTWGVGGLNIDASRIGTETITINTFDNGAKPFGDAVGEPYTSKTSQGRWPANIILDETTAQLLDKQSGIHKTGDLGGASRFFYVAKANKKDRNEGLDGFIEKGKVFNGQNKESAGNAPRSVEDKFTTKPQSNFHPTVKPTALMQYLIKLVTPPNGIVLDPFTGSGSTGKAATLLGYKFIGIELTADYIPIILGRLHHAQTIYDNEQGQLFE